MKRQTALGIALAAILVTPLADPGAALAQASGEKTAAAQALFDEAMRLLKAGQAAEACPKLEESQRLDAGMGTQFRLGECYEKVGKLASAWASFVAVADTAAVARLPEREAAARARAQALAPRLTRLTLKVAPAVSALEGVEIQRDGIPVARAVWGVPVPVDPGEHHIAVRAPGKQPWEGRITTSDAPGAVTFEVPPLADVPRVAEAPPPPPPRPAPHPRSVAPAIVLGVVAVAAAGAGVGLFVAHSGQATDAQSFSNTIKAAHGTCAPGAAMSSLCGSLASKASSSDTLGNASTVTFVVAGAAAAATIGYLLWPQPAATTTGRLRLAPALGPGQGGLVAVGSF